MIFNQILFEFILFYFIFFAEDKPPEAMDVEEEDYSAVMSDPTFLQTVLESLPGVDPQSEAVRQAVSSLQQSKDKAQDKEGDEKK